MISRIVVSAGLAPSAMHAPAPQVVSFIQHEAPPVYSRSCDPATCDPATLLCGECWAFSPQSFALILALATSLWSASSGLRALIDTLNIVYGEEEKRGLVELYSSSPAS
jgi:hypothetical protein